MPLRDLIGARLLLDPAIEIAIAQWVAAVAWIILITLAILMLMRGRVNQVTPGNILGWGSIPVGLVIGVGSTDFDALLVFSAGLILVLGIALCLAARTAGSIERWIAAIGCLVIGSSLAIFATIYLGAGGGVSSALADADKTRLADITPALAEALMARDTSVFSTGNHYSLWLLSALVSSVWTLLTLAVIWFHHTRLKRRALNTKTEAQA